MVKHNFLITGITGQDGIFLTKKIFNEYKNAKIVGLTRNKNSNQFNKKLKSIDTNLNLDNLNLYQIDLLDYEEVNKVLQKVEPSYIVNLSGPSSVYESLNNPIKFKKEIYTIFDNLTDACIKNKIFPSFFQPGSSEMFSSKAKNPLNENSIFLPRSPYSKAKLRNFNKTKMLREKYDWNIKSGILFNHESEFRSELFLVKKVIVQALKIKYQKEKVLKIGSLNYKRDWSYAEDIANAIYLMIMSNNSNDYVIGSGKSYTVKYLIEYVFEYVGLDSKNLIEVDSNLLRKSDPEVITSDPKKIIENLGWKSNTSFEKMLEKMINYETKLNKY